VALFTDLFNYKKERTPKQKEKDLELLLLKKQRRIRLDQIKYEQELREINECLDGTDIKVE
jgi:hypothetical protein|tara:strand:- start:1592 stop:1774 length:183 start_codon:yes stop_codon:yes gene_type:complete